MGNELNEGLILKEYEYLRDEIVAAVHEINLLARYAIIFCGAILALLFAKDSELPNLGKSLVPLVAWSPFVLTTLVSLRSFFLGRQIDVLGEYIKATEHLFFTDPDKHPKGWEHYLADDLQKKSSISVFKIRRSGLQIATFTFYLVLLALTFALALVMSV